jgi:D-proline reductase (dithiol) PrdB
MCNQSVGLVARFLEASGLPTMCLSILREVTERVRPPRAAWVNHPYGAPWGPPGARGERRRLVRQVLAAFEEIASPGAIADLAPVPGFESDQYGLCRLDP